MTKPRGYATKEDVSEIIKDIEDIKSNHLFHIRMRLGILENKIKWLGVGCGIILALVLGLYFT